MAGQQQTVDYNRESLIQLHNKIIMQESNSYYNNKYYKVNPVYDGGKFLHSLLLSEALCKDDCELKKFLDKRLRGALGDENIEIAELMTVQTKYRDINNYYSSDFEWQDEVKW